MLWNVGGGLKDHSRDSERPAAASLLPCLHGAWSASSCASSCASDGSQGGTVGTLAFLVVPDGGAHGDDAPVGGAHGGAALAGRGQAEGGHRDSHLGVLRDRLRGCQAALEDSQGRDLLEYQDQGILEGQAGKFALVVVAPLQAHLGRRGGLLGSRAGLSPDRQCRGLAYPCTQRTPSPPGLPSPHK